MGVELGIWRGHYENLNLPWLRWWDAEGNLLTTGEERAEIEGDRANLESQRANLESQRANREAERAERLAAQLRAMGIEPEA
jgi:hypothetical protein